MIENKCGIVSADGATGPRLWWCPWHPCLDKDFCLGSGFISEWKPFTVIVSLFGGRQSGFHFTPPPRPRTLFLSESNVSLMFCLLQKTCCQGLAKRDICILVYFFFFFFNCLELCGCVFDFQVALGLYKSLLWKETHDKSLTLGMWSDQTKPAAGAEVKMVYFAL